MAWLSFYYDGKIFCGWKSGDEVAVLGDMSVSYWLSDPAKTIEAARTAQKVSLADLDLIQPVERPGKILALALNYHAHAAETGRTPPKVQKWFVKQASSANAPYGPVDMPAASTELDYEAELVVVIGKYARHLSVDEALDCVAGYCCGCDYSVRDWQRASPTMIMGKGFDTHAPFGPWITPVSQIDDVGQLEIRCDVNGVRRQTGRAADMVFSIAEQISHLTTAFTLEPGDVIFTGTPAGVAVASTPPNYLKVGDRVRIEIDALGHIENTITAETGERYLSGNPK